MNNKLSRLRNDAILAAAYPGTVETVRVSPSEKGSFVNTLNSACGAQAADREQANGFASPPPAIDEGRGDAVTVRVGQ